MYSLEELIRHLDGGVWFLKAPSAWFLTRARADFAGARRICICFISRAIFSQDYWVIALKIVRPAREDPCWSLRYEAVNGHCLRCNTSCAAPFSRSHAADYYQKCARLIYIVWFRSSSQIQITASVLAHMVSDFPRDRCVSRRAIKRPIELNFLANWPSRI